MTAHVLVIDDDPVQRRLLKNAVERYGHLALLAENGKAGLELLKQYSGEINVVVLDLMMPEMDGLTFLKAVGELGTDVPVIVQTGQGGIDTVVQAMRAGAFDFVVKPVSPERIGAAISNALKLDRREAKARTGRRGRSNAVNFTDIVSASPAMLRVIELAQRAAQSSIPVVLEGESGVGKEMVARAIQAASERAHKPFVTVNCGAIPHNLVESILFGHEKGAFTGATEKHVGKFMEADGGTLFLDEIGDLPLDVQVKLLRAVQQGEIETVGSARVQKVNVRLISATNKNLIEEVKEGRFREDLYYRLNVFPITIPALRRRKEDIPHLARVFAERFSAEQKLPNPVGLNASALALLTAYDWPGNIRQSRCSCRNFSNGDDGDDIIRSPSGSSLKLAAYSPPPPAAAESHAVIEEPSDISTTIYRGGNLISSMDESGNIRKLAEIEEELIRFALRFYRGQMSQVARKLGIGRSTLYRKLKDYGIDPDDPLRDAA
ncbi:sigma-54 interaction domain-containing protein [Ditylenchus destructor]|nr:sigma-54 interaction domain-containing protein [Ditylenchus destructor]